MYFLGGNHDMSNLEQIRNYVYVHDLDWKQRWRGSGLTRPFHSWKFGTSVASFGWNIFIYKFQERCHSNNQWGVCEVNRLQWMDVRTERWSYRSVSSSKYSGKTLLRSLTITNMHTISRCLWWWCSSLAQLLFKSSAHFCRWEI